MRDLAQNAAAVIAAVQPPVRIDRQAGGGHWRFLFESASNSPGTALRRPSRPHHCDDPARPICRTAANDDQPSAIHGAHGPSQSGDVGRSRVRVYRGHTAAVQDRTLSDRRREHRPARWVRDHRTRQCLRHPPLSLRDISPSRGEIGRSWPAPRQSPPLWGRCPAGQRGVSCRHVAYGGTLQRSRFPALCTWPEIIRKTALERRGVTPDPTAPPVGKDTKSTS
jgi:hypothetical protein